MYSGHIPQIAKYRAWTGSCEQYTTCDDVMESRQPYCGWCVYKNRSTNLQYCRDHEYIHPLSIGSCWSFVNNFSVIGERNRVDLKIKNFRENRIASNFTCRFLNGNEEPMTTVANVTRHGDVSCESPNIQSYTELTLEFLTQMKDGETIGLIRATVALFKCQHLKRCGSCLETGSSCQWCSKSATCHPTGTCLDNSFVTKIQCPKIIGDGEVRYIPSGFPSPVRFAVQVSSMMDLHYLTCQIPSISPDVWPASIDRHNKIKCTITIESDISDSNKTYDVVLKYGTAIFDVEGTPNDLAPVTVTVYRCENLGFDCHRCRSLNKTKYNCTWCESSGCAAIASGCSPASVCPAPVITAVKPQCGSTAGGTVVTLMGSELQALSAVSLAGKNCIMDDKATHTITDGTDDRVLCTSESLSHESSVGQMGHISYEDVSGKIFTANASFTYLEPIVQGIYPAFGPRSGGTLVTIYGQNLWFGNMGITASLYDGYFHVFLKNCRTLEPGQEARTECNIFNSSMACRVPKPLYSIQNTDSLSLWFTNQSYSFSNIKFSFVDDPVILKISPKKAILSGGTEITVEGRNLNNSHTAVVSVDSYGEKVEAGCFIYSAVKIICSSPTAPPSIKYNVKSLVTKGTDNHIRCKCLNVKASITLNGTFSEFDLQYYPDPELYPLTTDGDAVVLSDKEPIVTIMGKHLDSGVAKTDVTVKAGDLVCNLLTLTKTNLTCYLPRKTLLNSVPMNVTVEIGNLHWMVGRVRCKVSKDLPAWLKYTVAATTVVLLFGLGCLCVMVQMQKFRRKIRKFQREVQEKEIEIGTLTRTLKRKNIGSNDYNYIDMNELDPNEYFKLKRGKKEASEERDQNNEGTIETDHKYLAIGSKDLLDTSQFDNDGDDENAGVDDIDSDYIHVRPDSLVVTVATIEKHEMGQEGEEGVECDVDGPEELEEWPVGEPPSTCS